MNTETIVKIVSDTAWPVLIFMLPFLIKQTLKHWKDLDQKKAFKQAVDIGYLVVHQIARKTENTIDDKIAHALGIAKEVLGRELSENELVQGKALLQAKHEVIKNPGLAGLFSTIFNKE